MSIDSVRLAPMANAIRALSMDAVQAANSGHPGMPMGMADVATVLYAKFLKFDPGESCRKSILAHWLKGYASGDGSASRKARVLTDRATVDK